MAKLKRVERYTLREPWGTGVRMVRIVLADEGRERTVTVRADDLLRGLEDVDYLPEWSA